MSRYLLRHLKQIQGTVVSFEDSSVGTDNGYSYPTFVEVHDVQLESTCNEITLEVLQIYCSDSSEARSNDGCYPVDWYTTTGWNTHEWTGLNYFAVCDLEILYIFASHPNAAKCCDV